MTPDKLAKSKLLDLVNNLIYNLRKEVFMIHVICLVPDSKTIVKHEWEIVELYWYYMRCQCSLGNFNQPLLF